MDEGNKDFIDYICNNFKRNKAYFYYKQGNIIQAHNLFTEASVYKNKESTDYHLYMDWGEMCEEIAKLTMGREECIEWFDNTIHNFIYTIVYKLDKAKFVIPRMIDFIKEFDNQKLKNKFNNDLDEIPVSTINDYLADLYYMDGYAFRYVESFLKMFYLIFGQAYSRGYL